MADEISDQRVLDPKDSVGIKILVAIDEDVGCEFLVIGRCDHEVYMGGPPGVARLSREHVADRAVIGDCIWEYVRSAWLRLARE